MMKTIFRLFMVALLCLAFAGPASAGDGNGIRNSKHDFSADSNANSTTYSIAGESRICVFCHTPHNAAINVPLWNRSGGTGTYLLYTSSATLTSATKASVIDQYNISYKCLSCHDGTISIGGGVEQFSTADMAADVTKITGSARINDAANSLRDDHPIGFDYDAVKNGTGGGATDAMFNDLGTVTGTGGLKFYKAAVDGSKLNQMECATCHDVHNQSAANTRFLRTANTASALCRTCHIK